MFFLSSNQYNSHESCNFWTFDTKQANYLLYVIVRFLTFVLEASNTLNYLQSFVYSWKKRNTSEFGSFKEHVAQTVELSSSTTVFLVGCDISENLSQFCSVKYRVEKLIGELNGGILVDWALFSMHERWFFFECDGTFVWKVKIEPLEKYISWSLRPWTSRDQR